VATHGGSLNRSTRWVSAKTCEGSNHDTDPLEDMRCLFMRENVTPPGFGFGDGRHGTGNGSSDRSQEVSARRVGGLRQVDQLEGGAGTVLPSPTLNPSFRLSALDGVATVLPLLPTITRSYRVALLAGVRRGRYVVERLGGDVE